MKKKKLPDRRLDLLLSQIKETVRAVKGVSLFDSQLAAARSMLSGNIAQLPTGEGKTLAAVAAAVCLGLQGRRTHVLVWSDYLAARDWAYGRPIYEAFGLQCGCVCRDTQAQERKAAYGCGVVYVSAKEAAFDYLRDFLCMKEEELLFPGFDAAIVDEADSILIDEGKTPLVLAKDCAQEESVLTRASQCVALLELEDMAFEQDGRLAWLTDRGIARMEAMLGEPLYDGGHAPLLGGVQCALEARCLLQKDRDYIVRDGAVVIVEPTTGRAMPHKRYPGLLHRAVEIKEGLNAMPLTSVCNSITMQNFLLLYPHLCGMTGTAAASARELRNAYGLKVDVLQPHTPCVRVDHPDAIFPTREAHRSAILRQTAACSARGRPVLLGTRSVEESEAFSCMLAARGVPHHVLNARNDREEAALIARAGEPGRVTVSTNMAGRGVDILLGGPGGKRRSAVLAAGGLMVLGTGLNASLRIDDQLRGRAGRQGDPGESRFFLCLEDGGPASRREQREQEREDAETRFLLQRYSYLPECHRREITTWRRRILKGELLPPKPERYGELCRQYGAQGAGRALRQLTLSFINLHWAAYLAAIDDLKGSLPLLIMGGQNPLEEFSRSASRLFVFMAQEIRKDTAEALFRLPITPDGVDLQQAGLTTGSSAWTYALDDSAFQFSLLCHLRRQRGKSS